MTELIVRRATAGQLNQVLAILNDAASWLIDRRIRQWPASFESSGFRAQSISVRIDLGTVYLVYLPDDDFPAGTFGLDNEADPDFWTEPDDALYVHRMAVRRVHAGRGIGRLMLSWAADLTKQADMKFLRLDCAKDNDELHSYYRGAGFEQLPTVDLAHRVTGARFQREAMAMSNDMRRAIHDEVNGPPQSVGRPPLNPLKQLQCLQAVLAESRLIPTTDLVRDDDGVRLVVPYTTRHAETVTVIDGSFVWGFYLDHWHPGDDPRGCAGKVLHEFLGEDV